MGTFSRPGQCGGAWELGKPSWELGGSYGSMGGPYRSLASGGHYGSRYGIHALIPASISTNAGMGACMGADMGAAPIPAPIHAPIPAPILWEQVWEYVWERLPFVLKRIPRFPIIATKAPVRVPKLQLGLQRPLRNLLEVAYGPFKRILKAFQAVLMPIRGFSGAFRRRFRHFCLKALSQCFKGF